MKYKSRYLPVYIPAILTIIGFLIPNIDNKIRWWLFGLISLLYYVGLSFFLLKQVKDLQEDITRKTNTASSLESEIHGLNGFVKKRELFIKHDLEQVVRIVNEYDGYLKDKYREKKYETMKAEYKLIRVQLIEITLKEKRDFDEQLFEIQSNKNN